jgi:hypothetical protein
MPPSTTSAFRKWKYIFTAPLLSIVILEELALGDVEWGICVSSQDADSKRKSSLPQKAFLGPNRPRKGAASAVP